MKKLFAWLIKPPVLSLLGVLVLSLLVWFEAPLFAFDGKAPFASTRSRWILITLLFLGWAGWFGWKWLRARLANLRLARGVAENEAPAPLPGEAEAQAEAEQLARRMQEAMAILRKARLGGRKGGWHQLPWYMFVGAPGSGKTTALMHSGLKFPLADALGKTALGGVGGTRNCDWWFTDEAVLLDTAGRYTTQDSYAEVDKAAWGSFLRLLSRNRPRRPVNGVIVALPVADLLQQSEAERRTQALAIRARIKELHDELGIRFPIYVIVTKCDLLAGFIEFFDNLGRDERSQVWGVTFPPAAPQAVGETLQRFAPEFAALEQQLHARLLDRMQEERDLQRRALIYNFPQQFAALADPLQGFLNEVFGVTAYEEPALLRGVYFTSGTQEGSPIDRVMSSLAAGFGLDRKVLPPNAFGGRSYFITRLLREVIFPESELAGANLRLERNRRYLQWTAIGLAAVLLITVTAGLVVSHANNQEYVDDVAARAGDAARLARAVPDDPSPLAVLPLLEVLRDIPGGYQYLGHDVPLKMRFGLYQGDKLGEGAVGAYHKALAQALMPRIVGRMEDELRRGGSNNMDYLYELLRVYLMLGQRSHLEPEAVQAWIDLDWQRNLPAANEAQRQALSRHAAALLADDTASAPQLDAGLVSQTRLALARMPMGERVYNRVRHALAQSHLPEFDVASNAGRDAPLVLVRQSGQPLTRGIPGMYTVAGYKMFFAQLDLAIADVAKDNWVLDRREAVTDLDDAAQIKAAVTQLYYDDYIRQWDALLADVVLAPSTGLDQAARSARLLSGPESPLRKFLLAAARETTLEKVAQPKSGVELASGAVKDLRDAARRRLEAALGDVPVAQQAAKAPRNPVDAHFDALHKLVAVGPAAGGAAAASGLDQLLGKLKDVATFFEAANAAKSAGAPPPPADALLQLKRDALELPAPLDTLVKGIDSNAAGLTQGSERARIDSLWTAMAGPFCRRAIAGRYPLVRGVAQEVTPDDFGRFFGPGGMMDDFFQKNLQVYVDTGGARWRWRTVNGVSLGLPQEVLDDFQRAATVRDRYFAAGGQQASMRFDLKVAASDPAITKLGLDIDGQPLAWAPGGPARSTTFQVPSGKGVNQVHLELAPSADLRTEGPWAWMRMLDKGVLESAPQAERFRLTYDIDGRKVVFDLVASSVNNAFRREALEQFRCREHL
ncbi:type VI secretion system membrane subunit TssM [Massilia horti]|uniref:Type VI secretion system membrane subunit TssM n=1 Tax=Massilia horti TaxID=2562153 RepID=A0A4Y9T4J6_9BURK|nr:type VI secretion system membrane subunit TssM [Massilia horti]TFW31986.1 type VI secretion system membrane subunit TssM [Massilia horti]